MAAQEQVFDSLLSGKKKIYNSVLGGRSFVSVAFLFSPEMYFVIVEI